jgi:hypothetical protein
MTFHDKILKEIVPCLRGGEEKHIKVEKSSRRREHLNIREEEVALFPSWCHYNTRL